MPFIIYKCFKLVIFSYIKWQTIAEGINEYPIATTKTINIPSAITFLFFIDYETEKGEL